MLHRPVLLKEVFQIFDPKQGEIYIDATVNGGGHAKAILKRIGPRGQFLGIDWDCDLIRELKKELGEHKNIKLVCDNYAHIQTIVHQYQLAGVNGILFDIGFSSYHIEKSKRGFSFLKDENLDMRYNPKTNALTAEKIINEWPKQAVETILREYGEERNARRIASAIQRERSRARITRTRELVRIISSAFPRQALGGRIHLATRTFQALRIAVNNELENFKEALESSLSVLAPEGKIVVISFHSLEDRLVKTFFKKKEKEGILKIITKKPITPSYKEVAVNPRSRSAKLRAAQKKVQNL